MSIVNTETGEIVTEADVDASIARVIDHAESIWNEWAWQVENRTWLIKGYVSWDEMRLAVYTNLAGVQAPRQERPELVARFRNAGLTQKQTADTLGVSQQTVSNYDAPRQEHSARSTNSGTSPKTPEPAADAVGVPVAAPVQTGGSGEAAADVLYADDPAPLAHLGGLPAPSLPREEPAEHTAKAADAYAMADPGVQAAKYRAALMSAVVASDRLRAFQPERITEVADADLLDTILRHARDIAEWGEAIRKQSTGLRLVKES